MADDPHDWNNRIAGWRREAETGDREAERIKIFAASVHTSTPAEIATSLLGIRSGRLKKFGIAGPDGSIWAEVSPAEAEPILDAELRRRLAKSASGTGRGT